MSKMMPICTGALAALACAGSVGAHHSYLVYQTTPIWIQGSVVRFEHVNPHTIITLEDTGEHGKIRLWAVEGPSQAEVDRRGIGPDVPKVGDTVKFCAFPYKSEAELSRIWPGVDFSKRRATQGADGTSRQFVAGHVMVMSNGERRLWEPHGLIGQCIRSSDEPRQSWLDFLNRNPAARETWCRQRGDKRVQADASLKEFVEEINSSIDHPCE